MPLGDYNTFKKLNNINDNLSEAQDEIQNNGSLYDTVKELNKINDEQDDFDDACAEFYQELSEQVLSGISDAGITYKAIGNFFKLGRTTAKEVLDYFRTELDDIGSTLKQIALDHKSDFAEAKTWQEIIQYSYNAYIVEKYLHDNLGGAYYTSTEDHEIFHNSKIKSYDLPDFKNVPLMLGAKYSVEVKCGVHGKDQNNFHNADYILFYNMPFGTWLLIPYKAADKNKIPQELQTKLPGIISISDSVNDGVYQNNK